MNKYIKILLIIILLIILINSDCEKFYESRTFNKLSNIKTNDDDIFNFNNLNIYNNELIDNIVIESGIDKCINKCEGNCVEWGVTGVGVCFPPEKN